MPFTDEAWSSPESSLSAEDFAKVCLIDLNPPGKEKVKGLCRLPVRNTTALSRSNGACPRISRSWFAASLPKMFTAQPGVSRLRKRMPSCSRAVKDRCSITALLLRGAVDVIG